MSHRTVEVSPAQAIAIYHMAMVEPLADDRAGRHQVAAQVRQLVAARSERVATELIISWHAPDAWRQFGDTPRRAARRIRIAARAVLADDAIPARTKSEVLPGEIS